MTAAKKIADSLAVHIRSRRLALRLTQEDLARRAGVSRAVVIRLEKKRGASPNLATLGSIANALGVELADLLPSSERTAKAV